MKSFQSPGLWFLPSDPATQIPGEFSFSEGEGLRLKLTGSFQHTWSIETAQYPVVQGKVSESPYGKSISLFDCFATSLRFGMPSAGVETIRANHGFAGTDFVDSDAMLFDGASLNFSSLGVWLNFSGLKFEHGLDGMGITWKAPESIDCKVDGAVVGTGFGLSTKGGPLGGAITLEETAAFSIGGFGSVTAREIHSRFLGPLSNLMTFAADGRSNLDRYTLLRSSEKSAVPDKFDRLFQPAVKFDEFGTPRAMDLLFTLDDVKDRYEPFMQRWFEFVSTHPDFCTTFFAHGYEKHGFLETRFLFQMQAAECLVREESQEDPTLKVFDDLRKAFLKNDSLNSQPFATFAFPTTVQMATPTLFAKFLSRHWPLVSEMVGTTETRFIETLFATLDYVNTRGKRNDSVVTSTRLYRLLERLTAVLKISVLNLLGFTDEEIQKIVRRNSQMRYLSGLKSPWESDEPNEDDDE